MTQSRRFFRKGDRVRAWWEANFLDGVCVGGETNGCVTVNFTYWATNIGVGYMELLEAAPKTLLVEFRPEYPLEDGENQAFQRMIIDHPDDDAPRLAYADWLEERGCQVRAEFIRVQVRDATLYGELFNAETSCRNCGRENCPR